MRAELDTLLGIVHGCLWVVNRAWPDHDGEVSAGSLKRRVEELLNDDTRREELAGRMAALATPEAADEVAGRLLAVAGEENS